MSNGTATTPAETGATTAEIDASCRWPVLLLFWAAAFWLLGGSVFGLIASLKFHAPGFLANCPWFTYGRVHAAHTTAWVYGAAAQAAMGMMLWICCRLGRTKLAMPGVVIVAMIFWNTGMKLGLLGILHGDSSGLEFFELPRHASMILFLAYLVFGVAALATFAQRRVEELFPSQWFLLSALFWFPWIASVANLLLHVWPVRGAMQILVHGWYVNNLFSIWLGFIGLAALFYFIPKLANRPLHTRSLALMAFWTLALFGSWAGIPFGVPLPAWIPAVSSAASLVTLVAVISVAMCVRQTLAGAARVTEFAAVRGYFVYSATVYVVAGTLTAVTSLRAPGLLTQFTWFTPAMDLLFLYGFFMMAALGAIYFITPRIAGVDDTATRIPRRHFWLAGTGVGLVVVPLAFGGVKQGLALDVAVSPFPETMKLMFIYLRISTLGDLLIALGHMLLVVNLLSVFVSLLKKQCGQYVAGKPAEVTA